MKQEKDREVYNQKTLEAMKEAKKIARDSKYPSYENLDELKKALLDEDHRKKGLYNKCWGDTTTVSLPTLFFCKKISI